MSIGELVIIGIIILLVVPPEKLPKLARDIGRFLNDIRRNTSGVWEELKKDVPNPVEELKRQKQEAEDYMKLIGSPDGHQHAPLDQSHVAAEPTIASPSIQNPETQDSHPIVPEVEPVATTPQEPSIKKPSES
jgi:sec-independent protein translocase protein TatB